MIIIIVHDLLEVLIQGYSGVRVTSMRAVSISRTRSKCFRVSLCGSSRATRTSPVDLCVCAYK